MIDIKQLNASERRTLLMHLMRSLRAEFQPNTWDELLKLWHDDLSYKKDFLSWLKEYWNVPTRRTQINEPYKTEK